MTALVRRLLSVVVSLSIAISAQIIAPAILPTSATTSALADALPALVPEMKVAAYSGDNGFTVTVSNYDPAFSWGITSSQGTSSYRLPTSNTPFSIAVRNLPLGSSATLTVTTTRAGYANGVATVVGYSKSPALVPALSEPTPIAYGFTMQVTNYDSNFQWQVNAAYVTSSISDTGLVTLTGIYDSSQVLATVTTTRNGYAAGTASRYGSALPLAPGLTPTFSTWTKTKAEISAQITNFDQAFTWTLNTHGTGNASISDTGLIEVSGLTAGQEVWLIVTSSRYACETKQQDAFVLSLKDEVNPEFGEVTSTQDGFSVQVTNFTDQLYWRADSNIGSAAILDGLVSVWDLAPGQSATVTVTSYQDDYASGTTSTSGVAQLGQFTPWFSETTPTTDGFTAQVTNYSPDFSWLVSVENNLSAATISDSGLISVTGLAPSATARVVISTTRTGYQASQVSFTGRSQDAPEVVSTPDPTPSPTPDPSESPSPSSSRDAADIAETALQIKLKALVDEVINAKVKAKADAEEKATQAAAAQLAADLKAVSRVITAVITMKSLSVLTPSQIGLVPLSTIRKLSPNTAAAITPNQAAGLTVSQMKSLSPKALVRLSPAAIGSLKPEAFGSLSVAKLKSLSRAQVKEVWLAQLLQLDPEQKRALRR